MMESNSKDKAINAGVHGSGGTEFQKYCALHVLLESYEGLKEKKYFIFFEHLEDFLFCHLDESELLSSIDAYQAKKSSEPWSMSELYEPLKKIAKVGSDLTNDTTVDKSDTYFHELNFITNNMIKLAEKGSKVTVNEGNSKAKYSKLDVELKKKIKSKIIEKFPESASDLNELENISLIYIDLPKATKAQKTNLIGQFHEVFGDKVHDKPAAVDSLLQLFREVENTLNQGGIAELSDTSKRVDSDQVNKAISVITTKQLAFELWRGNSRHGICNALQIPVGQQKLFELCFQNSFDYFKDLKQVEHRKIHSFVIRNKGILNNHISDEDCMKDLYCRYNKEYQVQLGEVELKASIYAAYIEVKGI